MPSASELAKLLVERLLEEIPEGADRRVIPLLNGLGTVKYDELFVLFGRIATLLEDAGLEIVEPECGELVTSLDMSGLSLTLFWPDDELAALWSAPADTPAYRKGAMAPRALRVVETEPLGEAKAHERATGASVRLAGVAAQLLQAVEETVVDNAEELGRIDAIAGDGDHGIGMERGARAASASASVSVAGGLGLHELLTSAAEEWSEHAGGTSGVLWAAAITAVADALGNRDEYSAADVSAAAIAGRDAITSIGKATLGDKTMIDAISPYVDELKRRLSEGAALPAALEDAAGVATRDAEATAALRPKLGRARPLAEKSLGHPDAGAVSFALIATRLADEVRVLGVTTTQSEDAR
jgi:dihydroxyacetone kinase